MNPKEIKEVIPDVKGKTDVVVPKVNVKPKAYTKWILPSSLLLIILVSSVLILKCKRE